MTNKTELIKLDGTLIKSDGTTRPSDYFKFLEVQLDDYSDIAFTPDEASKIKKHLMHLSTGAAAVIPLFCGGPVKCPFADSCPFVQADVQRKLVNPSAKLVTPIGKRCSVETQLLTTWSQLYIDEYQVDPNNFTEFMMVREMAEIELLLWRLNNNIAKPENASLTQENTVGIDKQGNIITRQEISAVFEAKERLQARKSKLVNLMVGDRREKYKRDAALKVSTEEDQSRSSAKMRKELDRVMERAATLQAKIDASKDKIIEVEEVTTPEDIISGQGE